MTMKIGGAAGEGIMSAGLTFSKVATRSGYEIYDYVEYPSLVRGGHNVMQVTVGEEPVLAPDTKTDLLVALNRETVDLHKDEVVKNGGILCDSSLEIKGLDSKNGASVLEVPFLGLIKEVGGKPVMKNTAALGAAMGLLGGNLKHLKEMLAEEFADKKPEITELNHKVAEAGYSFVLDKYGDKVKDGLKDRLQEDSHLKRSPNAPSAKVYLRSHKSRTDVQDSRELGDKGVAQSKMVVTGNEAVALGAIAAGMQYAAIYPMTPISNILHTLAPLQKKHGFVYFQPEDEIAAINSAIGASFAGVRAMTATSGGGFCLMTEGLGLAGITEAPLVVVEGMRGAPATGLPTWTEQGDLRFILHAHQGEFPRIVLAPGDAEEAFYLTMKAFNLADKYQCPVIVLVDKYLCEDHQSFEAFDYSDYQVARGELVKEKAGDYRRYKLGESGVSPRSRPGVGNFLLANSDEHDEFGYSEESAENRVAQMDKRMEKLETCRKEDMIEPELFGPAEAEVTLVSWGSNKGAVLEAMKILNHESWNMEHGTKKTERQGSRETKKLKNSVSVNFLHLNWIWPFPAEAVAKYLKKAKRVINVEGNYSGQMAGLIREQTGIEIKEQLLKYDGRPIYWDEIVGKIDS
jgi:2-oxoglutarate ferredoxin oxidoreductase subunit alpha